MEFNLINSNFGTHRATGKTQRKLKKSLPPTSLMETKMRNAIAVTNERNEAVANVNAEIGKAGIAAIGITSAVIGCWAVACLIAGTISSGGPAGLVASFFSALAG